MNNRDRLREIKTFPALVNYLHEKMGWPINSNDFDDISFDYTPEELGIDAKTAAKIQEIKQMRPLSDGQPWGIFFVKFEPKRLPVVALRRILSRLVFTKRAVANRAKASLPQGRSSLIATRCCIRPCTGSVTSSSFGAI